MGKSRKDRTKGRKNGAPDRFRKRRFRPFFFCFRQPAERALPQPSDPDFSPPPEIPEFPEFSGLPGVTESSEESPALSQSARAFSRGVVRAMGMGTGHFIPVFLSVGIGGRKFIPFVSFAARLFSAGHSRLGAKAGQGLRGQGRKLVALRGLFPRLREFGRGGSRFAASRRREDEKQCRRAEGG